MRNTMRSKRNALTAAQQANAALALINVVSVLPQWQDAKRVAFYCAFDGEISALPLAEHARLCSKQVYLPIITPEKTLRFGLWNETTKLDANTYGILQPHDDTMHLLATEMDIVFMPLVAWDNAGNRLGMGGGYYDRALAGAGSGLKVGLAHACQQVDYIEPQSWDVPMDYVATDLALNPCMAPS